MTKFKIVSGGQTGVDQGALEAALALGLDFGGWAPARWLAEQPLGAIPEVYRAKMREYPDQGSNAQNYRERTKANVRDSQATLILVEKLPLEGGTKLTNNFAASIGRSHHVVNMSAANAKDDARDWLRNFLGMSSAIVLNGLFLEAVPKLTVKLVGIDDDFREYAREQYPEMLEERYDKASLSDYRKTHKRQRCADDPDCGEEFSDHEDSEYFRNVGLRRDTERLSPLGQLPETSRPDDLRVVREGGGARRHRPCAREGRL